MPTCHIAIISPYASLKLWPVSPSASEANIDQFHSAHCVVTSDTDHGPWSAQRSPGRPTQSPAPALSRLCRPGFWGETAYTCSQG